MTPPNTKPFFTTMTAAPISNNVPPDRNDRGASMVEYALLMVFIALLAFLAVQFAGNELSSTYGNIGDSVAAANAAAGVGS